MTTVDLAKRNQENKKEDEKLEGVEMKRNQSTSAGVLVAVKNSVEAVLQKESSMPKIVSLFFEKGVLNISGGAYIFVMYFWRPEKWHDRNNELVEAVFLSMVKEVQFYHWM